MIKSKNTKGLKGSVDCIDSDELKTLKADKKDLERQLEELKGYRTLWFSLSQDVREKHVRLIGYINKLKEKGDEQKN